MSIIASSSPNRSNRTSRRQQNRNRIVKIANPIPDGARYTTMKAAVGMIERGRAIFDMNGQLVLLDRTVRDALQQTIIDRRIREMEEQGLVKARKGRFFWNGSAGAGKRHRPGEVRS